MLGGGGVGCMGREEWCCSGVDGKAGRVSGWCTEALCNGLLAGVTCKGGMCLEGGVMPRWQWLILGGWGGMRGVAGTEMGSCARVEGLACVSWGSGREVSRRDGVEVMGGVAKKKKERTNEIQSGNHGLTVSDQQVKPFAN